MRNFVSRGAGTREVVDLDEVLRSTAGVLADEARLAQIRVDYAAPDEPVYAEIDSLQIQQVLSNLVRNAVEACEQAGEAKPATPRITICLRAADGDDEFARVEVTDNGPGVPHETRANLFAAFQTGKATGLGLGLWICWNVVERHGGRIELAESRPGRTTFAFSLPRSRVFAPSADL